jgi:1-acyl-sn-glycerol-3-phosphate acyltransferase
VKRVTKDKLKKRRVLGNDPFRQGAALRVIPPQRAAAHSVIVTPERAVPRTTPHVAATPALSAHALSPEPPADPVAHAHIPNGQWLNATEAIPHQSAPLADEAPRGRRAAVRQTLSALVQAAAVGIGLSRNSESHTDLWGRDARLVRQLAPLAEFLYRRYFRVRTRGAEHIPKGPCILVSNHAGAIPLDGPLLHLALKFERPDLLPASWLLEDQIFLTPLFGTLANRLGAVRANPDNALRLLSSGRPIIVFPEGTHGLSKSRKEGYRLQRFGRGGYVKIAAQAGVPIVPVATVGGNETTPLLAALQFRNTPFPYLPLTLPPLPAQWTIAFGEPLTVAPSKGRGQDTALVTQTNLLVQQRIEAMLSDIQNQ